MPQMHDKIIVAIDKALRANCAQPVLHKFNFGRPRQRRRLKPVNLTSRMPANLNVNHFPPHYNRMQLELYNHFEHYGTTTEQRTDLLRILTRPEATLQGIQFKSAKGFQNFMERDKLSDMPLQSNFWKGLLLYTSTYRYLEVYIPSTFKLVLDTMIEHDIFKLPVT